MIDAVKIDQSGTGSKSVKPLVVLPLAFGSGRTTRGLTNTYTLMSPSERSLTTPLTAVYYFRVLSWVVIRADWVTYSVY